MGEEEHKALAAAELYSEKATFQTIADKLEVSKSFAQVLVRRGIDLALQELRKKNPGELTDDNPGARTGLETIPPQPQYVLPPQNPRAPFILPPQDPRSGNYLLETTGIGRRVMLTPKCLMIYDLWVGSGFEGDLSDFLEDAVNFMYKVRPPAERTDFG